MRHDKIQTVYVPQGEIECENKTKHESNFKFSPFGSQFSLRSIAQVNLRRRSICRKKRILVFVVFVKKHQTSILQCLICNFVVFKQTDDINFIKLFHLVHIKCTFSVH